MDFNIDPMSLLWIFLILISIQPVVNRKLLDAARRRTIGLVEKKWTNRVILIVHRMESMSFLGIPIIRYINMEDSEQVLRAIETTGDDRNIDIVLHTPGGLALASLQIARAIRSHEAKVRVIIPHYAMSGGTLIALAADDIIMSPNAVLGPVDPQLGEYPAPSLKKLMSVKDINEIDDRNIIMADIAEKATRQLQEAINEIMHTTYGQAMASKISNELTSGKWTHDYPITANKAVEIGLRVSTDIPAEYMELMKMYPQPTKRSRTVEYLPSKRNQME